MHTDMPISALESNFLVRLKVGRNPTKSFLVPMSQIRFGWGNCTICNLPDMLKKAEKDIHSANQENPSTSKAKDGHGKITESQGSKKSFFSLTKAKVPEIVLPNDDVFTWSAFFFGGPVVQRAGYLKSLREVR